jgi:hypothetical protein
MELFSSVNNIRFEEKKLDLNSSDDQVSDKQRTGSY